MITIRKLSSSEFPSALEEIPDPPEELWLRGELPDEDENVFLSVVGSRKYSRYGKDVCEKIIFGLRGYPVVIVSGLALGIDSIAHRAAIDAGLKTLAIPGSGLDPAVIYPRANAALADEIVTRGGALLSEFEPRFRATEWSFPKRNRLMAGISKAVLVIEAEEKSGTLITARLALDYNRDVFAVPGDVFSPSSAGTNRLIREGAALISESGDVLRALGFEPSAEAGRENGDLLKDASAAERALWELISEPISKEELFRESGLAIQEFNTAISLLEINGLITEELGEIRRKA